MCRLTCVACVAQLPASGPHSRREAGARHLRHRGSAILPGPGKPAGRTQKGFHLLGAVSMVSHWWCRPGEGLGRAMPTVGAGPCRQGRDGGGEAGRSIQAHSS